MSTKATIAYDEGFHIYIDLNDDPKDARPVYIELDEVISADVGQRVVEGKLIVSADITISAGLWQRIARAVKESDK